MKRPRIGGSVLAATFAVNVLSLALPLVMLQIFDRVVPNEAIATLLMLMIGLGVAMVFDFALKTCRIIETTHAAETFELETGSQLARHLLNATPDAHGAIRSVDRFEALASVGQLRDQYSGEGRLTAIDLPFVAIFIFAVAWVGGSLALVLVASFAILGVISVYLRHRQRKLFEDRRSIDGRRYSFVAEFIAKAAVIKSNCMEMPILRRYERLQEQSVMASQRISRLNGASQALNTTASQATLSAVALVGGYMVVSGSLGLAELAACTLLSGRAIQPMTKLTSLWLQAESATATEKRCNEVLQLPQRTAAEKAGLIGRVTFESVSFKPPRQSGYLFEDLSFECQPGGCIAISGDDGSGKTSLLRMILGEQTADRGRVLVDGKPAEQFLSSRGPGQIAYLGPVPTIFETSIGANLSLSNDPARIKRAIELASVLGLTKAVNRLPNGFETIIGGKGATPLPEGTLQLIALIRVLAMKPRILLFNEANNAMDGPSDKATLAALMALRDQSSLIMVSRRPSYVAIADKQISLSKRGAMVHAIQQIEAYDAISPPRPKPGKGAKPTIAHLSNLRDRLSEAAP